MKRKVMLLVLALTFLLGTSAMAAELVVNGGFETGNFFGWNTVNNGFLFVDGNPASGSNAAWFGTIGGDSTISQVLPTVTNANYTVSFDLQNLQSDFGTDFSVVFDGITLFSQSHAAAFPYTHFAFVVSAPGPGTLLSIAGRQDPSYWNLDNVSVQGPSAPIPGSLLLLGSGLLGLLGWRKVS